jgi:hypothetical protein
MANHTAFLARTVSIEARAITTNYPKSLWVGSISQKPSSLIPAAPQNNRSRGSETVRRVTTLFRNRKPSITRVREGHQRLTEWQTPGLLTGVPHLHGPPKMSWMGGPPVLARYP